MRQGSIFCKQKISTLTQIVGLFLINHVSDGTTCKKSLGGFQKGGFAPLLPAHKYWKNEVFTVFVYAGFVNLLKPLNHT